MEKFKQLWIKKTKNSNKLNTIKFYSSVMMGVLGTFLLANTASFSENFVFLSAEKTTFVEGEYFSVDVMINASEPINAVSATIIFPSDQLSVEGINVGRSVLTLWTKEPTVSGNQIFFSGGSFKRGFKGEHLLGTIKFFAKKSGKGEMSIKDIQLLTGDGLGNEALTSIKSGLVFRVYQEESEIPKTAFSDFNGEKEITLKDVSIFIVNWRGGDKIFDLNGDNKVNLVDFSILLARYSSGKAGF